MDGDQLKRLDDVGRQPVAGSGRTLHRISRSWHNNEPCYLPPTGWACTRVSGHDGPCAAVPADPSTGVQLTDQELDDPEYMRMYVADMIDVSHRAVDAAYKRGRVEAKREAGPTGPAMPPRLPVGILDEVARQHGMRDAVGQNKLMSLYRSMRHWLGLAEERRVEQRRKGTQDE